MAKHLPHNAPPTTKKQGRDKADRPEEGRVKRPKCEKSMFILEADKLASNTMPMPEVNTETSNTMPKLEVYMGLEADGAIPYDMSMLEVSAAISNTIPIQGLT